MARKSIDVREELIQFRWIIAIASLRLTLFLLMLFGVGVVLWHFSDPLWRDHLIAWPLLMLAVNLIAALFTHPTFRRQPWLLMFHLAILVLLLVVAIGQLTMLVGEVEVTEGTPYDSSIASWNQGYLHTNKLDRLAFELVDFSIHYEPEDGVANRKYTRAHLRWMDSDEQLREGVIGDKLALRLEGYRFTTTHNKGFAPWFVWYPHEGDPVRGAIHLHPWPAMELKQSIEWEIPGTERQMWSQLQFDEVILDPYAPSQFRAPREHVLVMRFDDQRHELRPGDSLELPEGRLVYQELRTWMGFRIFYDWTLPWLLAAGLVAVIGLGGHYWKKFHARPWLDESEN